MSDGVHNTGASTGHGNLAPAWQKGQSGNPGGRPKVAAELRNRARVDSPEAYETIVRLMREADKDSTRLQAAVRVLQIAGVTFNADVNLTVREERGASPYAGVPTAALLAQASQPLAS